VSTYRTGNHWGVTIVREGYADHDWEPFNVGETLCNHAGCRLGKTEHAQLVAVVVNGNTALAERICALLNGTSQSGTNWQQAGSNAPVREGCGEHPVHPTCVDVSADDEPSGSAWICTSACREPADSCTCTKAGPDPACPVHQGRRARGPKPPYLGPGCVCDGSGRTCPRHGAVI
jgi:hypothetical protein